MILPRRMVPPLALLVALLTLTVGFVVGIGEAPSAFLGGEDTIILGPPGGQLPGRAELPAELVEPLRALPYVQGVSPEVFAITVLAGRSALARGIDFDAFLAMEEARVVEGRLPRAPGEALAGVGFLTEFDLRVGSALALPGPTSRLALPFRVVGVLDAEGPARDELLLSLDDARALASVSPGAVHVVRIVTSDAPALRQLLDAIAPTFTYSDVRLSALAPVADEPVVMRANVTNWGLVSGVKHVEVRSGGRVVADVPVFVPARSTIAVEVPFFLAQPGRANITVNPSFDVDVRDPGLRVIAPAQGALGRPFTVRVTELDGAPRSGVLVQIGAANATTDGSGHATVLPRDAGTIAVVASVGGRAEGATRAFFADAAHEHEAYGVVERLDLPQAPVGNRSAFSIQIRAVNLGGREGVIEVPIFVDGEIATTVRAALAPGQRSAVTAWLGPLASGNHTIRAGIEGSPLTLRVYGGHDPRAEQLLEAYERQVAGGAEATEQEASAYIDDLLGNVRLAVIALALASGALAFLGAVAVISRHLGERAPSLGALKALGASDEYALGVVAREGARAGAWAGGVGVAVGLVLAAALDATGYVRAFGHAVHPSYPWAVVGLLLLGSVIVIALTSFVLARGLLDQPVSALLQGGAQLPRTVPATPLEAVLSEERA